MGKEINMNPGQQQQIKLNPNDLEDVVCEKCENQTFEPVFLFKKLSIPIFLFLLSNKL